MKMRHLHVQNMKRLRDFRLDFMDPLNQEPRSWTVLVGRNARGKSTILQAIALAAAGRDGAPQLLIGHMGTLFDRRQQPRVPVQIDAEFSLPALPNHLERSKGVPSRELPHTATSEDTLSSTLTIRPTSRARARWMATRGMAPSTPARLWFPFSAPSTLPRPRACPGHIEARPFEGDPRLMTATDLYREIFGITDPPPTDLARDLVRCEYLGADPERTDAEDAEVQALLKSLAAARVRDLPVPVPRIPAP